MHDVQCPLPVELAIRWQRLHVGGIEPRRSIRRERERKRLPSAAALLPRLAFTTVPEKVFQRPEQVAAKSSALWLCATEDRALQHMREELMRQFPRRVVLATGAAEERDHRSIVVRAQVAQRLSRLGCAFRRVAHKRPARGVKGIVAEHGKVTRRSARSLKFHQDIVGVDHSRRAVRTNGDSQRFCRGGQGEPFRISFPG